MPGAKISGLAVTELAAGFVLFWSGFKNATLRQTLTDLAKGKLVPDTAEAAPTLAVGSAPASSSASASSGSSAPAAPGSLSANESLGRLMAAAYGWTGAQWNALYALWQRESGWSATARNPTSGALGIAQSLGHGTASSGGAYGNEYPSKAANDGQAAAQIAWGLSYIKSTYGSPEAAWAHEQSQGWY